MLRISVLAVLSSARQERKYESQQDTTGEELVPVILNIKQYIGESTTSHRNREAEYSGLMEFPAAGLVL